MTTAQDVRDYLINKIRANKVYSKALVGYGDIAEHFGMAPMTGHWLAHPLCNLFGQLDQEDGKNGSPFITAFVINKQSGYLLEDAGFWKSYTSYNGPVPNKIRLAVWDNEVKKGHKHYMTNNK